MDYKYHKLSDHSLKVLLQRHKSLRYEAQLELYEELQKRTVSADDLRAFETELDRKKNFLNSLGYLEEMGYNLLTTNSISTLRRRIWPQITDLTGMVIGALFVFVGVYGILNLYNLFTGEESVALQGLIVNVFYSFLGYKGFQMLQGLPRFINNSGMIFSFSKDLVTLEKRIEFKIEKFTGVPSDMHIEELEEILLLKFKDETILMANPNSFMQRATLRSMLETIQKGAISQKFEETDYAS